MATAMILLPRTVIRAGDVVMLKAMISHPMETGFRRTETGGEIPRNIIRQFSCRYAGELVFSCDFHPAIAANPFLSFPVIAARTGPLEFVWRGDNGFLHREQAMLQVAAS
jgi:sulfur-oxidizing protein SoxZ